VGAWGILPPTSKGGAGAFRRNARTTPCLPETFPLITRYAGLYGFIALVELPTNAEPQVYHAYPSADLKLYSGIILVMISAVSPILAMISDIGLYACGASSIVLLLIVDEQTPSIDF
jgi:hypothetical protein